MAGPRFHSFVIFAEMRTGSNFLERNLSSLEGVFCEAEAFNPDFPGEPNRTDVQGITLEQRDQDPKQLLNAIKNARGLGGFRYFHDHDPRVFDMVMDDPGWAKIVLTRNPLDSYVSLKIAQATGQWRLTNAKAHKSALADFDADEFHDRINRLQSQQIRIMNALQKRGQTAFYIDYEDLHDVDILNGLAAFLGVEGRLDQIDDSLKIQNPTTLEDKVQNYEVVQKAVAEVDVFNLTRTPNFEPRRGPAVPNYITAAKSPLLFMPIGGGPTQELRQWLADLDGVLPRELGSKLTQKELRQWKREQPRHRSFTILRHPLLRAHDVFCHRILNTEQGSFRQIRNRLVRRYKLKLPETMDARGYDISAHRDAFADFLRFLKQNIVGQTAVRVDGEWCSQTQALAGFGTFSSPDLIIREEELENELAQLAARFGRESPVLQKKINTAPFALAQIYDEKLEKLARDTYQRDYIMLGFDNWSET